MVRVDVAAGQAPAPPTAPCPAVAQGPADMYCSPYVDYYPPDHYFVPPHEMCPQPPHLCNLHGEYGPVMPMVGGQHQQSGMGVPVQLPPGHVLQQVMDEGGNVRHVLLPPQPPPHLPPHLQHPPPQHPPQHYGPSNGANGPQQFYGPPGYPPPPPHFHPHGPPPMGPGPPPSHMHMPPLPYHRDERAQRQYVKLRKKLEQKQIRGDGLGFNSGLSTPALSPRKEFSNGGQWRGGASSQVGGTSSEGEGSSSAATSVQGDEEQPLLDYLSSLLTPHVSEVTARTALVQWSPPRVDGPPPPCGELRYELLLGDKGRYKAIYSGQSLSCRVQDLRPGTEYSVCLQAHSEGVTGAASSAAAVCTPPVEPGAPAAPRTALRARTSLQLRWQGAPDNGSPIKYYILQYDEGKGGDFIELCRSKYRQHNLQKLEGSTRYRFRLAAANEVGQGPWSEEVAFWTCGSPPPPPAPPTLTACETHALALSWERRPGDDQFTLQMEDKNTQHGFIAAYEGRDTETHCEGLTRYTNYVFRLRAQNDDGGSRWSDEVAYRTLPERPGPPSKPVVKGKKHTQSFKVRWDPPLDKGGTDIRLYTLEIKSDSDYEAVYTGPEQEATCDRLRPGHTYLVRVGCTTAGGTSVWSEAQSVTTEPTVPGPCHPPSSQGDPRPTSLSLRWDPPDYDGGSPILEYNLEMTREENSRLVYKGSETECTVHELLPGRRYTFKLKALNRAGGGAWSESLELTSGAAPPEIPLLNSPVAKSPFSVRVEWEEPPSNGGPITEYILEMSLVTKEDEKLFSTIFNGLQHNFDIKNLAPYTGYCYRVCACNVAGRSEWSEERTVVTPAAVPAAPPTLRVDATATDALLGWQEPDDNGSPISHYRIDAGDRVFLTEGPITEYKLDDLSPESTYRIRIQAVNDIGIGNFSPTLKFETMPPPPEPPALQLVQQGHNFLKLKWGDGKNLDFTQYTVEMRSPRRKEFQIVYQGTGLSFRVKKLHECTVYKFRVCAYSEAGGQGEYSEPQEWETVLAPPTAPRAPRLVEQGDTYSLLEWGPPKGAPEEPLTYVVQCCRSKDLEYKEVYRGQEMSTRIEDLEGGCEYLARVCAERSVAGSPLAGPWAPAFGLCPPAPPAPAPPPPSAAPAPRRAPRRSAPSPWTDNTWALVIVAGCILVAVIFAVGAASFVDWRNSV